MDITIPIILVLGGALFYFLSYITPKTDILFYGMSAILFLTAGAMGMAGFNDYPTSDATIVIETDNSGNNTINTVEYSQDFEDTTFLDLLPALFVLISIYQFTVMATEFKK